jgi:hypothetical protein
MQRQRARKLIRRSIQSVVSIVAVVAIVVGTNVSYAAKPADTGFNANGYNYNARIYKNFYPGYPDAYLVMKWSKDWTPMGDQPVGAWTTNHWTWYSNEYDEDSYYGWDARTTFGTGSYRIEEFSKIQSVGNDPATWEEYEIGGAYSAGWGAYPTTEVPRYVVFQDVVTVYDNETGAVVAEYNLTTQGPKGLGKPIF